MSAYPAEAEALFHEGNRCLEVGDTGKAGECFRQALALAPEFAEVLANLALVHERGGAVAEAEACYRRAIALRPDCVQVYLNLGVLLMNRRRFADAEEVYRQALALAPESPAAWSNYGVLLACMKHETAAEECYRTAIALDAGYSRARFNLSYVLLRQGRFEEGWRCLEAREWYGVFAEHFDCPRWRGEALDGKSIVISIEAGHGDMIQFCRYAPVLGAMGAARISVICHPGLKSLLESLPGVDEVLSLTQDPPGSGWDYWTPPLSLPYYCRTRMDSIPAPVPYLAADPARLKKWSSLLPQSGFRVGLAWKGSPHFENDADRSLPSLHTLAPLAGIAGVHFISLQKGPGEEEALHPPAGFSLLAWGHMLEDFADTAAVIAGLDLVISVDTAVAHLAGALGKPCWVLLPDYRTDWRWLTDRNDSPWYPQRMRLFRQPAGGGWPAVVAAVADALEAWLKQGGRR